MNEDIKSLLEQVGMTEDALNELSEAVNGMVDSAVAEALNEAEAKHKEEIAAVRAESADATVAALTEQHEAEVEFLKEQANTYGEHRHNEALEKLKEYADYVAKEFIAENETRLVETEEYFRMRDAMAAIHEAFESNGFSVDDEAKVRDLESKLDEAKAAHETLFSGITELREEIDMLRRESIFEARTRELTDSERENARELLEQVSFGDIEEYEAGVEFTVERLQEANRGKDAETLVEQTVEKATPSTVSKYTSHW